MVNHLANDQGFSHLIKGFNNPVNLGCANAYPARIKRGIGTAMNNNAGLFGKGCPVTMSPDIWIDIKIGLVITAAIAVIPETDRHGGEGGKTA